MSAREMQMEFERRVTLMNPAFELEDKLTSDTIFSFLNAYTERYVRSNYLADDQLQRDSRAQKKNADDLKGLVVRGQFAIQSQDPNNTDKLSDRITLPQDYFLYIRSNSLLSKNYKIESEITDPSKYVVAPNKLIKEDDVAKILSTYYNKAILLNPYIVLNSGSNTEAVNGTVYANIIHDEYTVVKKLDLVYYRKPKRFDVIGVDNKTVLDHCELPDSTHMEIVEGAVEMFITEAKYRLNVKQPQQRGQ